MEASFPTANDNLPGARMVSAGLTFGLAIAARHQTFADRPIDYWAYSQIEAFARLGIVTGCGVNELGQRIFCPDWNVTRAKMAVILIRAYP